MTRLERAASIVMIFALWLVIGMGVYGLALQPPHLRNAWEAGYEQGEDDERLIFRTCGDNCPRWFKVEVPKQYGGP